MPLISINKVNFVFYQSINPSILIIYQYLFDFINSITFIENITL
jgi:hypothetical protein